jgi:N-acetylglucosaminyldiphosphoundecaprenol N-acetyl-beta-D-mannosaminyltransferase
MAWYLHEREVKIIKALLFHAKAYNNYDEVARIIDKRGEKRFVISFLNLFAIQIALKNEDFFNALIQSDLLLYDGIGVKSLCNKFNIPYGINMNGTDFIPWLLNKFKSKPLLVFASSFTAVSKFKEKFVDHNIQHIEDGFKDYDEYINAAAKYPYDIILLGMGMPKQEILASRIKTPGIIVNGGAIVDYMSEVKRRAPKAFIALKIEWIYRIIYEPKRLFIRYFS